MGTIDLNRIAAKTIASFIRGDKNLNACLTKEASAENLNPMQITATAALVNHGVNEYMRQTSAEKTFVFDVADPEKIIGALRSPMDTSPVPLIKEAVDSTAFIKTASDQKSFREILDKATKVDFDDKGYIESLPETHEDLRRQCLGILEKIASRTDDLIRKAEHDHIMRMKQLQDNMSKLASMVHDTIVKGEAGWSEHIQYAQAAPFENTEKIFTGIVMSLEKTAAGTPTIEDMPRPTPAEISSDYAGRPSPMPGLKMQIDPETMIYRKYDLCNWLVEDLKRSELDRYEFDTLKYLIPIAQKEVKGTAKIEEDLKNSLDEYYLKINGEIAQPLPTIKTPIKKSDLLDMEKNAIWNLLGMGTNLLAGRAAKAVMPHVMKGAKTGAKKAVTSAVKHPIQTTKMVANAGLQSAKGGLKAAKDIGSATAIGHTVNSATKALGQSGPRVIGARNNTDTISNI